MSRRVRLIVMLIFAPAFAALLGWAVAGLEPFGTTVTAYATTVESVAPREQQISNIVASVVYDIRAFDSLGEEMILFASVSGVVLLLRERRGKRAHSASRSIEATDLVRLTALVWSVLAVAYGVFLAGNGHLSPGGGFQGGVATLAALVLFYLAAGTRRMQRFAPTTAVEALESAGALGFLAIGCGGVIAGSAFLFNWLPAGKFGSLDSAGVVPLISFAVGMEVAAGLALLLSEFAQQLEQ